MQNTRESYVKKATVSSSLIRVESLFTRAESSAFDFIKVVSEMNGNSRKNMRYKPRYKPRTNTPEASIYRESIKQRTERDVPRIRITEGNRVLKVYVEVVSLPEILKNLTKRR